MSEHYIRAGRTIFGEELVAVSEEYLDSLLPSFRETIYGAVWSVCVGTALPTALILLIAFSWTRLAVAAAFLVVAAFAFLRWQRLRRGRAEFRERAKAESVGESSRFGA